MKVSEAIDRLKVGDEVWVKSKVTAINFEGGYIRSENTKTSIYLDGDAEISLTEPQAEKVEITERQERLLKKYEDEPFHRLLNNCRTDDEYLLARARLNGYTVKQEQKYRVRVNGRIVKHLQFLKDNQINSFTENGTPMTFTDKSKAEAVATLVEGSVEEV